MARLVLPLVFSGNMEKGYFDCRVKILILKMCDQLTKFVLLKTSIFLVLLSDVGVRPKVIEIAINLTNTI